MWKQYLTVLLAAWLTLQDALADPIKLVTGDGLPPYTGTQLSGGGMLTEIVQRAFQLAGMETTLEWAPWKRGYELTKIGAFDATFPYARMSERENEYLYSDLLFGGIRSVYARPDSGIDPADTDSFRGRSYCVPTGFVIHPRMEPLLKERAIKIQRPTSLASCVKMLALGRVDFYIADSVSGDAALQQAAVGAKAMRIAKPIDRSEFYLIVPKSHPAAEILLERFNAGLRTLKARREYRDIVDRHPN